MLGKLYVIKVGLFMLFYDLGCYGFSYFGIIFFGFFDEYVYSWVNYLFVNFVNCVILEIMFGLVEFFLCSDV